MHENNDWIKTIITISCIGLTFCGLSLLIKAIVGEPDDLSPCVTNIDSRRKKHLVVCGRCQSAHMCTEPQEKPQSEPAAADA